MSTREKVFTFIRDFKGTRGYAPSVREIGAGVGLQSISTVSFHLRQLREDGLIDFQDRVPRSIVLK